MERINKLAERLHISRQAVYHRIRGIEEETENEIPRILDREGFRVIDENTAKAIENYRGKKPGRKTGGGRNEE